jgi:hypothetical protein
MGKSAQLGGAAKSVGDPRWGKESVFFEFGSGF